MNWHQIFYILMLERWFKLNSNRDGKEYLLSLETKGIKLGLDRTKKLLNHIQNPEANILSVQIIGTNGKGSTAASLSSILEEEGLKVGLFTSPHLIDLTERIQVNRQCIDTNYIDKFINKNKSNINSIGCTFFEVLTAMAIMYFHTKAVDIAILETGLGGKYDSVTACKPALQLFTSISMDHMNILGCSIEEITTQKASAMQFKTPCISVQQEHSIKTILNDYAKKNHTTIEYINSSQKHYNNLSIRGVHQTDNINLAVAGAKQLYDISTKTINEGIKKIFWPGRTQILHSQPTVIFDVAHNDDSLLSLCDYIKSMKGHNHKILLLSIQKTKQLAKALDAIKLNFDTIICTQLNDRMYTTTELYSKLSPFADLRCHESADTAIETMMQLSNNNNLLVIAGSHYWGKHIESNFKFFLVNNIIKS